MLSTVGSSAAPPDPHLMRYGHTGDLEEGNGEIREGGWEEGDIGWE